MSIICPVQSLYNHEYMSMVLVRAHGGMCSQTRLPQVDCTRRHKIILCRAEVAVVHVELMRPRHSSSEVCSERVSRLSIQSHHAHYLRRSFPASNATLLGHNTLRTSATVTPSSEQLVMLV